MLTASTADISGRERRRRSGEQRRRRMRTEMLKAQQLKALAHIPLTYLGRLNRKSFGRKAQRERERESTGCQH